MADRRIAVVGTGGLARAVCYALASVGAPVHVAVVGRDAGRAAQLCYVANTRAALAGSGISFVPASDLAGVEGVLVCASTQSPWERHTAPSAWTALLTRAGFGLTLPFQAELALRIGRELAGRTPRPWLINACFPDAVNPLLAALGVPVLCGIGNIGLLAASMQAALGLADQRRLHVLAHHVHLHPPGAGTDEVRAWLAGRPIDAAGDLLAAQRATERSELNNVTGYTAAVLLAAVLRGEAVETNLPGPLGLPGGYPVRVEGPDVRLRLPDGMTEAEAVAFNQRAAAADGVVVGDGRVEFGQAAAEELTRLAPRLADGFDVADLATVTTDLHALRTRLRTAEETAR